MKITEAQVVAACRKAQEVFYGGCKTNDAVETLVTEHGLNKATALDFIRDYKCLMEGLVFHRAMSASAMRYFMEQIFNAHNEGTKINAISSLRSHIAYYENHYKTTMQAMRAVADDFDARIKTEVTAADLATDFEHAVQKSLLSNRTDRLKRLANAPKTPTVVTVKSRIFVRNPDVVAEVLLRADGKCESCLSEAPFMRKKDGSPYLEVHHRIQLASGGDDSVENSVALCPNCHRQAHYG